MTTKILLTGKNGQVGFELQRTLGSLGEPTSVGRSDCDLGDADAIRELIRQVRPNIIVNAAAYTAVDKAESDYEAAYAVNAVAPGVIGEEAAKLNAFVVHYSTDYVFDGSKVGAYVESDVPNPQNIYGASKLTGEQALLHHCCKSVILRTSWVVGAHGNNFAKTILQLAADRDSLNIVADQYGAPTSAVLLADLTAQLVQLYLSDIKRPFGYGIYHAVASGETNWCDFARFIVSEALSAGKPLKVNPERIHPILTSEYPTPAKRPANSRLDTQHFQDTFGLCLPHWQESVRLILQQIL